MLHLKTSFNQKEYSIFYIKDLQESLKVIYDLQYSQKEVLGLDIETLKSPSYIDHEKAGLCPLLSSIRLIQLFDGDKNVYIFDLLHLPLYIFNGLFASKRFVAHNAKFEIAHLTHNGYPDINISCSMLMSQMIYTAEHSPFELRLEEEEEDEEDSTTKRVSHSLSAVVYRVFHIRVSKYHQVSDWSLPELASEQLLYAGLDAILTYDAAKILSGKIKEYRMEKAYKVIKDMQHVVAEMELTGFPIDWSQHHKLIDYWGVKNKECVERCKPFFGITNLRSSKQMGAWLENYLKDNQSLLFNWPKTEKGAWTFTRTKIFPFKKMPAISALLDYKKYAKLLDTFGEKLIEHKHPITGRIHPSFTLGETVTGRMSCRSPNLQQIPNDSELRDAFKSSNKFVVADFGQIELRVQAELSHCPAMRKVFKENGDIYKVMAAAFTGRNVNSISKEDRQIGKVLMLSLGYGMGPRKLKDKTEEGYDIHLSEDEAERAHSTYHKTFSTYSAWCSRIRVAAEQLGFARTVLGKIRKLLPDEVYTKAPNHVVQGTSFEILALACVNARNKFKKINSKIVNIVHDEVIVECNKENIEEASEIIKDCMIKGMLELFPEAPITGLAEPHSGITWKEAKG